MKETRTKQSKQIKQNQLQIKALQAILSSENPTVIKNIQLIEKYGEDVDNIIKHYLKSLSVTQLNNIIENADNLELINYLKDNVKLCRNKQKIYIVHVSLRGLNDKVWRLMEIPSTLTLAQLSYAVMSTMKCEGSHLFDIKFKNMIYDIQKNDSYYYKSLDANDYHIYDFNLVKNSRFLLTYDFGDEFQFDIVIQSSTKVQYIPNMNEVNIIDGKGYGIWEDFHRAMYMFYRYPDKLDYDDMETADYYADMEFEREVDNQRIVKSIQSFERYYNSFQ